MILLRAAAVASAALAAWFLARPDARADRDASVSCEWVWPDGRSRSLTVGPGRAVMCPVLAGSRLLLRREGGASGLRWATSWGATGEGEVLDAEAPASGIHWVAFLGERGARRIAAVISVAGPRDRDADAAAFPPVGRRDAPKIRQNPQAYAAPAWRAPAPVWGSGAWLSAQVRAGDFFSHDGSADFVVDPDVLDLFSAVVDGLVAHGIAAHAVRPISGYRSPAHNRSDDVGGAARSRHIYGDAVDFLVDADGDGKMDDLDGDGDLDGDDLWIVILEIERLQRSRPEWMGGGGVYRSETTLGSVHIDTRGHRARWAPGALDARWERLDGGVE